MTMAILSGWWDAGKGPRPCRESAGEVGGGTAMRRIALVDRDTHEPTGTWFDRDRVRAEYRQREWHDGRNWISAATGSQWQDETLFETASGRWVICHINRYGDNSSPWWYEIPEHEAYDWLLRCGYTAAIPEPEMARRDLDAAGPTPQRTIRMPDDLWEALQETARAEGADASTVIRRLVRQYVAGAGVSTPAR